MGWLKGFKYKHERMIAASFEVLEIRYKGPKYWKLNIMWWSHDGALCTFIVEKNKKIMVEDFKYYKVIGQVRNDRNQIHL